MAGSRLDQVTRWVARRRAWVQAAFLVIWLDPFLLRLHNVCGPVFHCYSCPLAFLACPIGVVANFSALHLFPFAAVGTLVAIGAIVGTAVCGWACPFGFLQDMAAKIPTPRSRLGRLHSLPRPDQPGRVRSVPVGRGPSVVLLPCLSGRGVGGRLAQHRPHVSRGQRIGAAEHDQAGRSGGRAGRYAVCRSSLVQAFLPARGYLRDVQSSIGVRSAVSHRCLQDVRAVRQDVSLRRAP